MLLGSPSEHADEEAGGFFLVGVLVFCFILIPVIAVFAQSSRAAAFDAGGRNQRFKVEFLVGGLTEAIASRLTTDRDLLQRFQGTGILSCRFQDMAFAFSVQDHDGKIDLNNANGALLKAGFRAASLSDEDAGLLQQYVESSRTANLSPYDDRALSNLPTPKHAPFERIEELNDAVASLKLPAIDFEPFFTVYKRAGNLEYPTAAKRLRDIIDASPELQQLAAADNGSFDYIDIAVEAGRENGRQRYVFLDTYARLSVPGEVRRIASKELASDSRTELSGLELNSLPCESLLGVGEGAAPHV